MVHCLLQSKALTDFQASDLLGSYSESGVNLVFALSDEVKTIFLKYSVKKKVYNTVSYEETLEYGCNSILGPNDRVKFLPEIFTGGNANSVITLEDLNEVLEYRIP